MSATHSIVTVVAVTHTGAVRPVNEDTIAVGPWLCCKDLQRPASLGFELSPADLLPCIVADGLGGHTAGQVASRIAAQSLISNLWGAAPTGPAPSSLIEHVADSVRDANGALYARMRAEPDLVEMGSTVAGVAIVGDSLAVFNVGDSRVYRWQDGYLCQLTTDDVLQAEVRTGLILQSLGGSEEFVDVHPHVVLEKWFAGRRYLICSDGLYDSVTLDAIESALREPPLDAVRLMLEQALAAGAHDNLSIVLIDRA
jgi:serine/threonine protein phosphatase PrpC